MNTDPQIIDYLKTLIGQTNTQSPSPMGRWLAGRLETVEDGSLSLSYDVRPEMTNPAGILHGGALSAMLDDTIGMTVYTLGRETFFATVQLHVDFIKAAKQGETVVARSQLIKAGRQVVHADCSLHNQTGQLLAKASSTLVASHFKRQDAQDASS